MPEEKLPPHYVIQPVSRYGLVRWLASSEKVAELVDNLALQAQDLADRSSACLQAKIPQLLPGNPEVTVQRSRERSGCRVDRVAKARAVIHFPELEAWTSGRRNTHIINRVAMAVGDPSRERVGSGPCLKIWSRLVIQQVAGVAGLPGSEWKRFVGQVGPFQASYTDSSLLPFVLSIAHQLDISLTDDKYEMFLDAANSTDESLRRILRAIDLGNVTRIRLDDLKEHDLASLFNDYIRRIGYHIQIEDNTLRLTSPRFAETPSRSGWLAAGSLPINSLFHKSEHHRSLEVIGVAYVNPELPRLAATLKPAYTRSAAIEAHVADAIR